MLRSDGCGWLLGAENRTGRRRCLPTARSLPFAWDLGTSRWQLSDQTTPLRNGDPGIAQSQALYKNPLCNAATDFTPVVLITEQPTSLIVRRDLPAENLALMQRRTTRKCNSLRPEPVFRSTWPACWSTSMSRMFLTMAEHPPCRIWSQVASII
jgi:hypothetical protein